ncbi:hypothetical protein [Escherichia coli]|uniref:hypothetical protein n=1 Tax=Escherichia coli TaxID=562 RepID=UPI00299F3D8F|nr:hypothetical protein [Escherichia coli]
MREILINESAREEMTCLFAPSLTNDDGGRFKKTLTVRAREQVAKIVSKNDPDTKKVWCKYGKIPGQGDGVNLFFVGEINVTHYFITNIGAGLPDACAE